MTTLRRCGVVALALGQWTCHQAILTAPPGSTISLFANPEFIAAHGDASVITAFVVEGNGTPVADGTVVQFFSNLGRIQEQAKTNDGVARVNLISDSRSGTATVTACSGGGGGGGTPTTTTTTLTGAPSLGLGSGSLAGPALAAAAACATQDVHIGSTRPVAVFVTANPSRITDSRSTHVFATVIDEFGNPVANVPVIFRVTNSAATEFMDSQGSPIFTDTNGRAEDVMRTRRPRGSGGSATVEVVVLVDPPLTGTVAIPIE